MEEETLKSAAAFSDYAGMGRGRSLALLAQKYGKSTAYVRQLERWSSQYNWQERVKRYDAKCAEERRLRREVAVEDMDDRQAEKAQAAFQMAVERIEQLCAQEHLSGRDAVQLFKHAADIERVARGADVKRVDITSQGKPFMDPTGLALADELLAELGDQPEARDLIASALLAKVKSHAANQDADE